MMIVIARDLTVYRPRTVFPIRFKAGCPLSRVLIRDQLPLVARTITMSFVVPCRRLPCRFRGFSVFQSLGETLPVTLRQRNLFPRQAVINQ